MPIGWRGWLSSLRWPSLWYSKMMYFVYIKHAQQIKMHMFRHGTRRVQRPSPLPREQQGLGRLPQLLPTAVAANCRNDLAIEKNNSLPQPTASRTYHLAGLRASSSRKGNTHSNDYHIIQSRTRRAQNKLHTSLLRCCLNGKLEYDSSKPAHTTLLHVSSRHDVRNSGAVPT